MAMTLTRNLSATTVSKINTGQIIAVPILYLDFPDKDGAGPDVAFQKFYAGSGTDITLTTSDTMPAATYIGVGGISSVSAVGESAELKAPKVTVNLNGIDSTYISLVLAEDYYGGDATLGLVLLDEDHSILANTSPIILFKGFMSVLTLTMQEGKADIAVELESILADWERPRIGMYNSASQNSINPLDRGFDNVDDIVNKEVIWKG